MNRKLLNSFLNLDLKCPWHDETKMSIENEILFCKNCGTPGGASGYWDIPRINAIFKEMNKGTWTLPVSPYLQKKLLLLKEYYDEQKTAE
jgi:hypothetical protein